MTSAAQESQLTPRYFTDVRELVDFLALPSHIADVKVNPNFSLRIPFSYAEKIEKGNLNDPLLKQILPLDAEQKMVEGYQRDPLAEQHSNPYTGIIHKYQSRLLLTLTGACDIHCRYCFRQHFNYQDNQPKAKQWQYICAYIQSHPDVSEIILSGGDPLSMSNRRIFDILDKIEPLTQIKTLRVHSRAAIVSPDRLDEALIFRLAKSRLQIVLVTHCNHANELDDKTIEIFRHLAQQDITLLNQTVLLRGINDNADCLAALSQRIFSGRILPYYLHVLDKVAGAAHFDLPITEATDIYWQLMAKLPGYLVPKLVAELPDYPHKMPVDIYANRPAAARILPTTVAEINSMED